MTVAIRMPDGTICRKGTSCKRHGAALTLVAIATRDRLRQEAAKAMMDAYLNQPQDVFTNAEAIKKELKKPAVVEHYYPTRSTSIWEDVSDEEVEAFTSGDCWMLADSLRKQTGYPVVAIGDPADDYWTHMGVQAPDGRIWDVTGSYENQEEFVQSWKKYVFMDGVATAWQVDDSQWHALTHEQEPVYPEHDPGKMAARLSSRILASTER